MYRYHKKNKIFQPFKCLPTQGKNIYLFEFIIEPSLSNQPVQKLVFSKEKIIIFILLII